jgi:hypothetical protein
VQCLCNLTPEKAKLVLARLQGRRAGLYDDDVRLHFNKHAKEAIANRKGKERSSVEVNEMVVGVAMLCR